jgi:predicted MFS family arabinose efflux permease
VAAAVDAVATDANSVRSGPRALVAALAAGQLISWGTLFYGITFLAAPIERDQGWSADMVFGAFSLALLVAGVVSLRAAQLFARWGSREVLFWGSVTAAAAFATLSTARGLWSFAVGWCLAGAAMAVVLYEGAYLAVRERPDVDFRRAVAMLTVVGGLASTVFWPLSRWLELAVGWRLTLAVYALLHLAVVAPLHRRLLPLWAGDTGRVPSLAVTETAEVPAVTAVTAGGFDARILWLAVSFALTSFVSGGMAAHLDGFFRGLGASVGWILAASVAFGPLQVAGRMLDIATHGRLRWQTLGTAVLAAEVLALATLFAVPVLPLVVVVFAALFGAANGLLTLVRPLAVGDSGGPRFAAGLLTIAAASLAARALAPVAVASALGRWGPRGVLAAFLLATVVAGGAWLLAQRAEPRQASG